MNRATRPRVARRVLAAALLALLASLSPAIRSLTTAQPATPTSMITTVRAVDGKTRMIEVIVGVGHATRLMRLQVADDCKIIVPWAAAHLSSFVPGMNARIEYVAAPATAPTWVDGVVVSIEALDIERAEGTP